ncbi:FHA domain-containing protein [Nocardioides perillae]|uniref:FHA domain-containing protein n=1 Tax=Nocardioides perillae TaxID=1119534 RepID=A0A7Y9UKU8_9ACTN|nr:FHA domain-containing protein [Nocardioides perillae]NYG55753.1 hypothetical protein [Nocardioides perillae]
MATVVGADLRFEVATPGGRSAHGHLHGEGSRLRLDVDDPGLFAGAGDAPAVRDLAETLARRGVCVQVFSADRHLVTLGAVSAPWWQRRVTRSRRIRLGSLRGAWTSARAKAGGHETVLPDSGLLPAPTLAPLFPTFARRSRRGVTTTHDPAGGGSPRLVLVKTDVWAGERQPVLWLQEEAVIGSDPSCDLVLPGLAPRHARVRHDEHDEYVVEQLDGPVRVHGGRVESQLLRTGSRVGLGPHRLVYYREEHADHGRPYGGRVGGELGRQRPQPPRQRPASG